MQDLTTKTLKELKAMAEPSLEIAYKNGIYYQGDRRQRQSWVSFLERCWEAGIVSAFLPKTEPAFEVNVEEPDENIPVVETQAQALPESSDTLAASPGIEIEAQEPHENIPGVDRPIGFQDIVDLLSSRGADSFAIGGSVKMGNSARLVRTTNDSFVLFVEEEVAPIKVQAQEPIEPLAEKTPGIEQVEKAIESQALEPHESKFGRIVYPRAQKPIAPAVESESEVSQMAIAQVASNSPGVEVEFTARDRFVSVGSRRFLALEPVMKEAVDLKTFGEPVYPEWPECWLPAAENSLNVDRVQEPIEIGVEPKTEPTLMSEPASAIEENILGVDRVQELGLRLSDRFLSLYAPPNFSRAYESEPDGQLKLLERVTDPDYYEPPDPDHYSTLAEFWAVSSAWDAAFPDSVEQFRDLDIQQQNNDDAVTGTCAEPAGADEIAIAAELPSGCDNRAELYGTSGYHQDEGLGSQKGDRLLEESGAGSGSARGVLSHQPPELTPNIAPPAPNITATFNDEQPPNRGDGRHPKLAIGMQVCHRSDLHPLGTITDIYTSKRGKLRAKIERPKIGGFVYFDCDLLVEEKFNYWSYPDPMGPWKKTKFTIWVKSSGCDVWVRKQPAPARTSWTQDQLRSLSPFQLKKIARDMGIFSIPGSSCKRSLMRAILVEQELRAIVREKDAPKPLVDRPPLPKSAKKQAAKKSGKTVTEPLGQQLSLNLFSAAY
ncbi:MULTISPECIES: hypothetical protein [unclassified Microcoleus]|uniref:hypothetical protein n=1 Tax=unclassified Microcoleus TaxID=2642155 RepID=UPI002FCF5507